ncbi:methylated-DNA--[protein]-cysteine S-methyltransferase [Tindallia californiensis]|uniref:methylated-DNA--[protein]-cysteine S-methyltransferase n=1 Tax=Tindallia californiensis TaxID=159292 RepID=A0A1H3IA07_9FIRM|nr:methylated-DNA--[protein]-cysteine S-methyltransferase [Tindallia californiensis]SDY24517.1 methylated-DNA-[protein]-cysteine S-methyltransferase [Tindallia californiensis]
MDKKVVFRYNIKDFNFYIEASHTGLTRLQILPVNDEKPISNTFDSKKSNLKNIHAIIQKTVEQLEKYLNGSLKEFDIPVDPKGTNFQKKVWNVLREIPFGNVFSYKAVAELMNHPSAYRAVGMANNKNPIQIIIPCHRVVGMNNHLTGFGSGIDVKKKLLISEGHRINSKMVLEDNIWT